MRVVLVLDDDPEEGGTTRDYIQSWDPGSEVVLVQDLEAAKRQLRKERHNPFTCIVVDLLFEQHATASGIEFIQWLMAEQSLPGEQSSLPQDHRDIPVFAMSWFEERVKRLQSILDEIGTPPCARVTVVMMPGDISTSFDKLAHFMKEAGRHVHA